MGWEAADMAAMQADQQAAFLVDNEQ